MWDPFLFLIQTLFWICHLATSYDLLQTLSGLVATGRLLVIPFDLNTEPFLSSLCRVTNYLWLICDCVPKQRFAGRGRLSVRVQLRGTHSFTSQVSACKCCCGAFLLKSRSCFLCRLFCVEYCCLIDLLLMLIWWSLAMLWLGNKNVWFICR